MTDGNLVFTVTVQRVAGKTDDMVARELGAILADAMQDSTSIYGYQIVRNRPGAQKRRSA